MAIRQFLRLGKFLRGMSKSNSKLNGSHEHGPMRISMRRMLRASILLTLLLAAFSRSQPEIVVRAASPVCISDWPTGHPYTVQLCLTAPADGSTLTGSQTVTATVTVTRLSTLPSVRRVVFYLNGAYLLTDYQSPYTFTLSTGRWVDGAYTLAAEALMSDNFVTQRASISLTFNNGVSTPPVNTNTFQITTGTQPAVGSPFVVAAVGDGASGETGAGTVSDLITSLNPNLFLYLGDVYEQGTPTEFSNWYGSPSTFFGRLRSITDPTIGNHEYTGQQAPGYFDYWDNIPSYYSFNASGWHFISFNSNVTIMPALWRTQEYNWLQADLQAQPPNSCIIAYYHHPYFNIGQEGPATALANIWQLLAQYGVKIVLNGHDHTYQRWVPLDGNGVASPNGVTEFVAGGGGHSIQDITPPIDPRVAYSIGGTSNAFGTLLLKLNSAGADFSYVNKNKNVLDSGTIPCASSAPDIVPPTRPGNFAVTPQSATSADVSWSASTDNIGVSSYTIYRNGSQIGSVPAAQLDYVDTTETADTTYNYTVDAVDAAGNHSTPTASLNNVLTLSVTSSNGTVNRSQAAPYYYGDVVQLTAQPAAGWAFANWTGDATGTSNPAAVTFDGNKSVTANYTAVTYTIGGNAGIDGATITYTGGSTSSDITGAYSFTVPYNWSGTVTPSKTGYGFSPDHTSYSNVTADHLSENYTATAITPTISGNAGVAGATLSYHDGTDKTATADGTGAYSFTVSYNWSGTVTPSETGYTFSPDHETYSGLTTDQPSQNYTATPIPLTISGNAGIGNATITYTGGSTSADSGGAYTFSVPYNWSGTVTPSMTGYSFTPDHTTYTSLTADQPNQNYTATAIIPTISGNAGVAGATLSYHDGTDKTATADGSGNYSFTVSFNWTGTVTPSAAGYFFTPASRSYSGVQADQPAQNYTAGGIDVSIAGALQGTYYPGSGTSVSASYPGMLDGPVQVKAAGKVFASQVVASNGSYNEIMGMPVSQFTTSWWYPFYDHGYPSVVGDNMRTWILVGNPSTTQTATVNITIGGVLQSGSPFSVAPGSRITPRWIGTVGGPVHVSSNIPIFTSERVFTAPDNSFNEMMGYPANQFTTEYWFPWYDNVNMSTFIKVGNTSSTQTANVDIYIGSTLEGSYAISHDQTLTESYPSTVDGPVRVVSTNGVNVVASEWTLSGTTNSFNEVMGYPFNQFDTEYWFPYYDHGYPNVAGDNMRTWILIGNPSATQTATVNVYINGALQSGSPFSIAPGSRITPRWIGTVGGAVHVVSDIPIFTSERVFTVPSNSFNEMMGYPASQLTTEYWFPWYDSVNMPNSLWVSRP